MIICFRLRKSSTSIEMCLDEQMDGLPEDCPERRASLGAAFKK